MAKGEQLLELTVQCADQEGNNEWQTVVLTLDQAPPEPSTRLDLHLRKDGPVTLGVIQHGKQYVVTLSEYLDDGQDSGT
jgi:hypothetical protein